MIQPGRVKMHKAPPPAVWAGYLSHKVFVDVFAVATNVGVLALEDVSPENIAVDFFAAVLNAGGTEYDVEWMIDNGVMTADDRPMWESAIDVYIKRSIR
ncbi:MAG: hypothetical protein JJE28_07070 [Actinomycetales bacterium]|nr:hypothetical protein [Actinomycetales bacterium]